VSIDQIASVLWRRRWIFLVTLAACIAAVVVVTLQLPKTYKATATLLVQTRASVVTTDLLDQLTRTYSTLASNPKMADVVSQRLSPPMSRDALLSHMSFAPVQGTQLLQISAEARTPLQAAVLANTYATTFVEEAQSRVGSAGSSAARITVSEPAVVTTSPVKPNPPLYIGLGTLLAILIALAVALLRERLDTRLRVAADDDRLLGQPIMARIPRYLGRGAELSHEIADGFGLLKTNIDLFDERPARVLMVTSPTVSEGKSTVAASLAATCAGEGEKVVLIEADLRRPGLERTLPLRHGATRSDVGLTNYLVGAANEQDIVQPQLEHAGLSVIWAGPTPPNPHVLLGSERLGQLLRSLAERYDRVIVDTPPIAVGADASVIVPQVDGVLYVVDEPTTRSTEAQAGLNQLRKVRAHMLGVVVNRARSATPDGYYYYRRRKGSGPTLELPAPEAPEGSDVPAAPTPPAGKRGRRRGRARV
jgi:capsular exopolysaccharide synthesis family protein